MDRFTWGIVSGALLLVVAGLAGVLLLQRPASPADLSRPDGVVRAYVEALESGRPERAWELLADSARRDITRDEFIRRATQELAPDRRAGRLVIERVVVEGDVARVELNRIYDTGGGLFGPSSYSVRSTVRLERAGDSWRIVVPPDPYLITPRPL